MEKIDRKKKCTKKSHGSFTVSKWTNLTSKQIYGFFSAFSAFSCSFFVRFFLKNNKRNNVIQNNNLCYRIDCKSSNCIIIKVTFFIKYAKSNAWVIIGY